MAALKLGVLEKAEEDCTQALALAPAYDKVGYKSKEIAFFLNHMKNGFVGDRHSSLLHMFLNVSHDTPALPLRYSYIELLSACFFQSHSHFNTHYKHRLCALPGPAPARDDAPQARQIRAGGGGLPAPDGPRRYFQHARVAAGVGTEI